MIQPNQRLRWILLVALNRLVSDVAVRVAIFISDHINNKTHKTFLSGDRIARALGISRTSVIRAVAELAEHEHLFVRTGGGKGLANQYALNLINCPPNEQCEGDKLSAGET